MLRPGRYPSLAVMNLNKSVSSLRMVSRNARVDDNRYAPAPAAPQITFYEREGFAGRTFSAENQVGNFERQGFECFLPLIRVEKLHRGQLQVVEVQECGHAPALNVPVS